MNDKVEENDDLNNIINVLEAEDEIEVANKQTEDKTEIANKQNQEEKKAVRTAIKKAINTGMVRTK